MAAVGSPITPRRPAPVGMVALKAATELNDILNALNLRVALLRHRSEVARLKELNHYLSGYLPRQKSIERMRELAPKNGFGHKPAGL